MGLGGRDEHTTSFLLCSATELQNVTDLANVCVKSGQSQKHCQRHKLCCKTDPEIDSVVAEFVIWELTQVIQTQFLSPFFKFGYHMALFVFIPNLVTSWRHLYCFKFWPPHGVICIGCKVGHQVALLALDLNLISRRRHLVHQVAPFAKLAPEIGQMVFWWKTR